MTTTVQFNHSYKPRGRIVFRLTGGGKTALAGVLHFDPAFEIAEGASYLARIGASGFEVFDTVVDTDLPADLAPYNIDYHLRACIWRKPVADGTLMVRFIRQWAGCQSWLVYGCAPTSPISAVAYSATGHAWFDVKEFELSPIAAPAEEAGLTMAQLTTIPPVWPNSDGVHHALCAIPLSWRPDYLAYSKLQVTLGCGELSREEFNAHVLNHERLRHLWSNPGDEYLTYLVRLDDLGGIQEAGPYNGQQLLERKERSRMAMLAAR